MLHLLFEGDGEFAVYGAYVDAQIIGEVRYGLSALLQVLAAEYIDSVQSVVEEMGLDLGECYAGLEIVDRGIPLLYVSHLPSHPVHLSSDLCRHDNDHSHQYHYYDDGTSPSGSVPCVGYHFSDVQSHMSFLPYRAARVYSPQEYCDIYSPLKSLSLPSMPLFSRYS